ncbi:hypothetical protein Hanom_Chr08g00702611 [Helianthus anomalus]
MNKTPNYTPLHTFLQIQRNHNQIRTTEPQNRNKFRQNILSLTQFTNKFNKKHKNSNAYSQFPHRNQFQTKIIRQKPLESSRTIHNIEIV